MAQMKHLVTLTLALVVVTRVGSTTVIHGEDGNTTVRQVGGTTVVTEPDGRRTYCRPVGPNIVCTEEPE